MKNIFVSQKIKLLIGFVSILLSSYSVNAIKVFQNVDMDGKKIYKANYIKFESENTVSITNKIAPAGTIEVSDLAEVFINTNGTQEGWVFADGVVPGKFLPLGSIIAVYANVDCPNPGGGWEECDGRTVNVPGSPYFGQKLPDLNNSNLFLRGGTSSGIIQSDLAGSARSSAISLASAGAHTHTYKSSTIQNWNGHVMDFNRVNSGYAQYTTADAPDHQHSFTGGDIQTHPVNFSVIWVMRAN